MSPQWIRTLAGGLGLAVLAAACTVPSAPPDEGRPTPVTGGWVYQLQGYPGGRLDELARAAGEVAVIDLARDAHRDYFRRDEIAKLRATGKLVLAYFEVGSIKTVRPEYGDLRAEHGDLILNRWSDWPNEYFVAYWDRRWWDLVIRPRVDQALRAGFDGVYLDTLLAYEELDLSLAGGRDRDELAAAMVELIGRISRYGKSQDPHLLVVPQNSPELRHRAGYVEAIDGIGMEDLFVKATDEPCTDPSCEENLRGARELRDAGKFVLAVDYADSDEAVATTCARYRQEGFLGYIGVRELDRLGTVCG